MNEDIEVSIIIAHIIIYEPKFYANSKKWKFIYDGRPIQIDISETDIAKRIIERRKIILGDTFKVKMERKEEKEKDGKYKSSYKVIEVLNFISGSESLSDMLQKEDFSFFQKNLPMLLKEHKGKFVLIKDYNKYGFYDSPEEALKEGYKKFGNEDFLIQEITDEKRVNYLNSLISI